MKKKFKLLTSIASLGLALALGVFGVLAATKYNVQINSTVSFEANNVNVTVQVIESAPAATINYAGEGESQTVTNSDATPFALGDNALDDTNTKYGYKVIVTNNGGTQVKFTPTLEAPTNDGLTGVTVTVAATYAETTLAATNGTVTYTVEVSIDPNTAMNIAAASTHKDC